MSKRRLRNPSAAPIQQEAQSGGSTRIAWIAVPTSVVLLVAMVIFPQQIGNLIQRTTNVNCILFKMNFSEKVGRAEPSGSSQERQAIDPNCAGVTEDQESIGALMKLSETNGRGVVMDSFRELELATIGATLRRNLTVTGPMGRVSGIAALDSLQAANAVPQTMKARYDALREARMLANTVTYEVVTADAQHYACAAMVLAQEFRHL